MEVTIWPFNAFLSITGTKRPFVIFTIAVKPATQRSWWLSSRMTRADVTGNWAPGAKFVNLPCSNLLRYMPATIQSVPA